MDKIVGHVKSASLHQNLDFKELLAPILFLRKLLAPVLIVVTSSISSSSTFTKELRHLNPNLARMQLQAFKSIPILWPESDIASK